MAENRIIFHLRYGFNSIGHDAVVHHLEVRNMSSSKSPGVLGINLGKNKISPEPKQDYVKGVEKFGKFADYITINVSSPNTPGLRSFQGKQKLSALIEKVYIYIHIKKLGGNYIMSSSYLYSMY